MEELKPSDLKAILHSRRAHLYYLEHCRVMVNKGRVEYIADRDNASAYYNIPIANTTFVLLGTGTSITQAAVREFAKAGVLVGFCGSEGSPLFATTDHHTDIEWLTPVSEYRPTGYVQGWIRIFYDERRRLATARFFQHRRIACIRTHYPTFSELSYDPQQLETALSTFAQQIDEAADAQALLLAEARVTRALFRLVSAACGNKQFRRERGSDSTDRANKFLDQGNYLAYGTAACAAWVLGLPFALAVLHGKTRRGALIFDLADLIKDALVLPTAFWCACRQYKATAFKQACMNALHQAQALDYIIDTVKDAIAAQSADSESPPP